jgi:hypothetical protein
VFDGGPESIEPRNAVFFTVPEVEDELSTFSQVDGHATEKARLRSVEPVELRELLLARGQLVGIECVDSQNGLHGTPRIVVFG